MDKSEFAIWWLSQADCESIGEPHRFENEQERIADEIKHHAKFYDLNTSNWPEYIQDQYMSRVGRAGRGRLWVTDSIPVEEIEWDSSKSAAARAENCGGIVIWRKDLDAIRNLAGFITDLDMNYL